MNAHDCKARTSPVRLYDGSSTGLLRQTRGLALAMVSVWLLAAAPAFGFFFDPATGVLKIIKGFTAEIRVEGPPPGQSGSLQVQVSSQPNPSVATTDLPAGQTRSGSGGVIVKITGVEVGSTSVTVSGKYNGATVSGVFTIQVCPPGSTFFQLPPALFGGDPVSTHTGEYLGVENVDFNLGGPMPLVFIRYVATRLAGDARITSNLGANRMHNFASKMEYNAYNERDVIMATGRVVTFKKKGTAWTLLRPLDVGYTFAEAGGNFVFGDPNGNLIWTYNSQGRLLKIDDGRGNTHTLNYAGNTLMSVTDGLGRSLTFTYSGPLLTKVVDQTNREVVFSYNAGVLNSATDQLGNVTTYAHTGNLLTSFTRPENNTPFTQSFTGGRVTSQTERGTDTSIFAYDTNARITTFTNPAGGTLIDEYSAAGALTRHLDEAGKATVMTYDSAGRRSSVTDRLGDKTSIVYHPPSGLPAVITNTEGRTTTMAYKSRKHSSGLTFHDLSKITFADGTSRSFTYDAKGNVTQVTDQNGKTWKFAYAPVSSRMVTATNPLGGVTTFSYDNAGNLVFRQDPDTGASSYAYEAGSNRLIGITRPGGATIGIEYDNKGRITQITDERGKIYTFAYDTNDRLTTVTDPGANNLTMAYDVLDRVNEVIDRNGQDTDIVYDSRHLVSAVTDRNGNTTSIQHDARRRPVKTINALSKEWALGFDDEGLVTSITNPENETITIKRNRLGRPVEISNPLGHTVRFVRDGMQRVTQVFDPLGRQTSFAYDKAGALASVTEQTIGSGKYTRDALGNITKITDPNGGSWSYAYLKSGRIASATDPLGKKWTYAYHPTTGRLQTTSNPDGTTILLTYDAAGNVTGRQHSGGPDLVQTYDDLGRLATVNDAALAGDEMAFTYDAEGRLTNSEQNGIDFNASYDNGGRLVTVSYMNGAVVVSYQYDPLNRLTQVTDNLTAAQVDFLYDDANRLTAVERSNNIDTSYTYDAAGRLTGIDDGMLLSLSFTLNAAGEIVSTEFDPPAGLVPAVAPLSELFKFGKASQIVSPGFVYDVRGRLIASPGKTFAWDGAGRLTNANGVLLAYNGVGDVIARTENAQVTNFYHHHALNLGPIVYEDVPVGSDRAYVWTPGGRLLYSIDIATNETRFYHFDNIGSTLALTDSAGQTTDAYLYGPYGEMLGRSGTSTQPFTYAGALGVRAEGSLFQMRTRYYDPATTQFLSRDPLPPRLADVKSLNPYQYARNNPLSFIDPQGGFAVPVNQATFVDLSQNIQFYDTPFLRSAADDIFHDFDPVFPNGPDGFPGDHAMTRPPGAADCDFFSHPAGTTFPSPPGRGFKIAENESPRPVDRIFTTYNHFNNVVTGNGIGGNPFFSDTPFGNDIRLPFASDGGGIGSDVLGNVSLTIRNAILSANQAGGDDISSPGLGITLPPSGIPGNTFSGNTAGGNGLGADIVSGIISNGTVISNGAGSPSPAPINPKTNLPKGIDPGAAYFAGYGDTPPPRGR